MLDYYILPVVCFLSSNKTLGILDNVAVTL